MGEESEGLTLYPTTGFRVLCNEDTQAPFYLQIGFLMHKVKTVRQFSKAAFLTILAILSGASTVAAAQLSQSMILIGWSMFFA
jgi:hypothetical protein